MNGLEALKKLPKWLDDEHRDSEEEYFKASEEYKAIEKELKAFEIVKEKGLSTNELWFIKNDKSFEEYTETLKELYWGDETLDKWLKTEDEFKLLREVFRINEKNLNQH